MKKLMAQLTHNPQASPSCWLMRQAGRYLPEYRELRAQAGGFMALALDPQRAVEVTLQPVRRFGVDGAILFSDILMVPYALGLGLTFAAGEGPVLTPVEGLEDVLSLENNLPGLTQGKIAPVFETLDILRSRVGDATLIGFAGAPWTVVTYMVEGGSSRDFTRSFLMMRQTPDIFTRLMTVVEEATVAYLSAQIIAGAEVVQLFDSWAGALKTDDDFNTWCLGPNLRIAKALRERHPETPVIVFPKGLTQERLLALAVALEGVAQGVGVGYDQDLPGLASALGGRRVCLQGNYPPQRLATLSAPQVYDEVKQMCAAMQGWPAGYIANLGHGVLPETPVENVAAFVRAAQGK